MNVTDLHPAALPGLPPTYPDCYITLEQALRLGLTGYGNLRTLANAISLHNSLHRPGTARHIRRRRGVVHAQDLSRWGNALDTYRARQVAAQRRAQHGPRRAGRPRKAATA